MIPRFIVARAQSKSKSFIERINRINMVERYKLVEKEKKALILKFGYPEVYGTLRNYDPDIILRLSNVDYYFVNNVDNEYANIFTREIIKIFLEEFRDDQEVSQLFIHMLNIYNLI